MESKVFRSRVSVLLMVIIFVPLFLPVLPVILSGNIFNSTFYTVAGIFVFIVLLAIFGMRCKITEQTLKVGMTSFPLSQIVSVERSYNLLSSPAASLKRLSIRFKKGAKYPWILISPAREQEFLETLKKYNPEIYIRVENKKGWWRIWDWDI